MDTRQAVEDLLWMSRRLKGIVEIGPQLEQISSLEQATKEAQEVLNKTRAEHDDLVSELKQTKEKLKKSDSEIKIILDKAKEEASEIVHEAKLVSEDLVYKAKIKFQETENTCKQLEEEVGLRIKIKERDISLLDNEIILRNKKLKEAEDKLNELRKRFA